jgi:hypothetical protein
MRVLGAYPGCVKVTVIGASAEISIAHGVWHPAWPNAESKAWPRSPGPRPSCGAAGSMSGSLGRTRMPPRPFAMAWLGL